jgi:hypothetical protein
MKYIMSREVKAGFEAMLGKGYRPLWLDAFVKELILDDFIYLKGNTLFIEREDLFLIALCEKEELMKYHEIF